MTTEEALAGCERWLTHTRELRERAQLLQQASALARAGNQDEAMRIRSRIDSTPLTYDGAYLEPYITHLVKVLRD